MKKTTSRVSLSSTGKQMTGDYGVASSTSISANGGYVAFLSHPAGLTSNDATGTQAYLHDRKTSKTELVSIGNSGLPAFALTQTSISVSNNGRFVTFLSRDGEIALGTNNGNPDVVVRDRKLGTTTQVSKMHYGASSPTISGNGAYIAFTYKDSSSTPDITNPILAGDTNGKSDVYLYTVATGALRKISRSASGGQSNDDSSLPAISSDGRYLVYQSYASNLVRGDTNKRSDLFRHDTKTGKTIRVGVRSGGGQIGYGAGYGAISPNGKQIQFDSYGHKITSHATGAGTRNTYVRDIVGKWPALTARVTKVPANSKTKRTVTITTKGIVSGQKLQVKVTPRGKTKGKAVTKTVTVKKNKLKVKAPSRVGTYKVTVMYDKTVLRTANIKIS